MSKKITGLMAIMALAVGFTFAGCGEPAKTPAKSPAAPAAPVAPAEPAPAPVAGSTVAEDPQAKAEREITADNVDAELEKLKAEIESDLDSL